VSVGSHDFSVARDETIHSWYVFRLLRRFVKSPAGEFERTFLDSPGAVGALAIDADNNLVLVRQYRASIDDYLWEIPAGMRDVVGESGLLTAKRELEEEAGFTAEYWERIGELTSAAGVTNSVVELFLARGLTKVSSIPHGPEEENMTIEMVRFPEAISMVEDGRITDAKSMIAILLCAKRFPELL
jgi:8-oxo-dGDP phosphatase